MTRDLLRESMLVSSRNSALTPNSWTSKSRISSEVVMSNSPFVSRVWHTLTGCSHLYLPSFLYMWLIIVRTGIVSWLDLQDGQPENRAVDICVGKDRSHWR